MRYLSKTISPSPPRERRLIVAALGALGLALMALLVLLPNRLTFAASVDLGVAQSASTASPVVGAPLTYTVVVTNGAVATEGSVYFTDTLPANVTLASVTTTQGTCVAATPVTCTLGPTLDANATVTVTIAVTPTAAGPANNQVAIAVTALDTDTFAGNDTSSLTLTVNPANTVITLITSGSPSLIGQSVTFTATVTAQAPGSGTPAGTVTFYDGGIAIGSNTLNGTGVASLSVANLSLGTHIITATYGGSANYNASTSATLTQQVNNPIPVLNSLSPMTTTAGASSPLALTLSGANFVPGAVAQWNGAVRTTDYVTTTELLATIPTTDLAFAGVFNVTAVNPGPGGGVSNVQVFTVTNPLPTLTSLSPNTATAGGPTFTLTVNGGNFVNGPYPSVVLWNNAPLTTTFVNASQLTATVTAANIANAGVYTVTVANPQPDGTRSLAQTQNFTVTNPTLSLTPSTLTLLTGRTANITITISGVQAANRTIALSSSNPGVAAVPASVTLPANTASITFTVTAVASGTATITATLPPALGGGTASANVTVNNPVPFITGLSPATTNVGGPALTLTVNGAEFVNGSVVRWAGSNLATSFVNSTQLTATVPAANLTSVGTFNVTVFNPPLGGGLSNALPFTVTYPVPVLNSLSPMTTTAGASSPLALTLSGANFVPGAVAQWNGAVRTTGYVTTTELLATIPTTDLAFAGVFNVTAVNPGPGGGVSNVRVFTVTNPLPTLTSLSPNTATAGGPTFTLTVNGGNFVNGPYPSVVLWNNAPLTTTFVNASQLTATVTAANIANAGVYTVTVANPQPDGTRSLAQTQNFTVTNPTLSLTPSTLTLLTGRTANITITISGVQAANRTIALSSSNPGVAAVPASVTLPANTASITFTVTAVASGTATITATLPPALGGGTASANVTVNNPVPFITGLSPATTNVGGPALTLTVNGAEFVNGSVVRWAGSNLATSFVNSTQLTATVPAANLTSVGTFNVTVFNPPLGGGLSNALPFTVTYPVPVLTAISPITATAGSLTTTLTLTGSNFVTASVVRWGGSDLSTSFVSGTRLTAVISTTLLAIPGPVEVRVFNPEPGGGRSAPQTFTVVSQTPLVRLGASSYVIGKNGGAIAIPVQQLSPIVTQTVTVTVATADGTALAGRDYTAISSTLVFTPGTFVQTVTVPILNNTIYTGNRVFTVLLSEPVNTLLTNPSTASVTIAETNARTGCSLYRNSTSLNIPDGNPAGVESVITLSSPNVFVDHLHVRVESLQHTFIGDLVLTLIAPDGRRVTLFDRFGGAGHNLLFTVFQDGGTPFTDVPNGAPYTGTFNPASSLGGLRGTPVSGAWRLHISDQVGGDEGELQAWSLDICGVTVYRVYLPFVQR
jgi:uncharacterized repeat protein (TIGR01451 family)